MIGMMIVIFSFSAQTASVSGSNSYHIAEQVVKVSNHVFPKGDSFLKTIQLETLDFVIRKLAHVTEYMILSITIFFHCWYMHQKKRKCQITTVLIGIAYACTDEFHQLFVTGRSAELRDVCIDSIGVLLGVVLMTIVYNCCQKKKVSLAE